MNKADKFVQKALYTVQSNCNVDETEALAKV